MDPCHASDHMTLQLSKPPMMMMMMMMTTPTTGLESTMESFLEESSSLTDTTSPSVFKRGTKRHYEVDPQNHAVFYETVQQEEGEDDNDDDKGNKGYHEPLDKIPRTDL